MKSWQAVFRSMPLQNDHQAWLGTSLSTRQKSFKTKPTVVQRVMALCLSLTPLRLLRRWGSSRVWTLYSLDELGHFCGDKPMMIKKGKWQNRSEEEISFRVYMLERIGFPSLIHVLKKEKDLKKTIKRLQKAKKNNFM